MTNQRGYLKSLNAKRAALWYRQPSKSLHLVLVSGEAGKSTTALYLYHILRADERKTAVFTDVECYINDTPYNARYTQSASSIQAALAAAKKAECDFVIIELTPEINQKSILKTLHYNSVLATTITPDLTTLFDRETEFIALPYADEPLEIPLAPHQIAYFGDNPAADIYIDKLKLRRGGTELDIVLDHHHHHEVATYLLGVLNAHNAAAAIAMAYVLGVTTDCFAEGIARLESVSGNLEHVSINAPYNLYIDSAKSTFSAHEAVATLAGLKKRRLLVAVANSLPLELSREVANIADQVVVYGYDSVDGHLVLARDRDDAIEVTLRGARLDDLVLFLGDDFAKRAEDGELEIYSTIKGTRFDEHQN